MAQYRLRKNKYKILLGIPIVILLASSLSIVRDSEDMCIVTNDSRYVEVGEEVTLQIVANADKPINAVSGTVYVPDDLLTVKSISHENSIIDLWSEEPTINDSGITFSGGIISKDGFTGDGNILTITVSPKKEGSAKIYFENTKMLAHDGTGMNVGCINNPITLVIRPEKHPSPDVNGDKRVNVFDFGIVSARLFMTYRREYDLNLDGKITIADILILISNMSSGKELSSMVISLF